MRRLLALLLILAALGAGAAHAQNAAQLIEQARARFDEFQPESAQVLLERVLSPTSGATSTQMVRAWVLYGIAQLWRDNAAGARQAFRQALQRNPTLRVDSLDFLHENLLREFNAERVAVAPAPAPVTPAAPVVARLTVAAELPRDTTLAVDGNVLPITLRPSRRARGIVTVSPADAPTVILWGDTLPVGASGAVGWNLRGRDGALVTPGRYALHLSAVDSAGEESAPIQRIVTVERVPADTQALPAPLQQSAFLPETLRVRKASAGAVLVGAGFGVAAAVLPTALGRTELNSGLAGDGTAYVVAGSVTLASLVGFLTGVQARYSPENAERNAETRQQDAAMRSRIVTANAQARARAPVRVRLEAGP